MMVQRKVEADTDNGNCFMGEQLDNQENFPCLDKEKVQKKPFYHIVTRISDIIFSVVGLIISVPILLIISVLMKKEEPGAPIFFSQIRVGKDGKTFKMYKVRSMVVDAEERLKDLEDKNEIQGAMFKIKDDPRVTHIGKFIRKTSIDELPQLLNVLKGEMTLVGPRPPLPREVEKYTDYDMQRLYVKPGCTGLWQVSGRNNVHFDKMVDIDIRYIEEQSLLNDWKIILKTIKVMVMPNDAY